ncbi:MAG: DUF2290 domain-containing protein [Spirulina sp.]
MNTPSSLAVGLEKSKKLLKAGDLLDTENYTKPQSFSPSKFSPEFFEISQSNDYIQEYKIALENRDYDLLLKDRAFFQFSCEGSNRKIVKYRYAYYEPPYKFPTYEEFLNGIDLTYEECGDQFYEEYEQDLAEAELKKSVTPLRYDYDETIYEPLIHSVSHLHIGRNNDLRIPIKYLVPPQAFVCFVFRHIYWEKWRLLINTDEKFRKLYFDFVKKSCKNLAENFFTDDEAADFYLS